MLQNEMLSGLQRQWEEWSHAAEELIWSEARENSSTGQELSDLKAVRRVLVTDFSCMFGVERTRASDLSRHVC